MKNIFIILFLIPCYLSAQDAQLEKYIDSLMGNVNRLDMPGTMLLVAKDGKPVIKKVYGMANLELQVAARPDHLFGIGSVSKQFTAVAILQLARQRKLNLADDIRKHLPGFNTHGKLITIEQLLAHTSGISSSEQKDNADFYYSTGIPSGNEFLEFAMKHDLLFAPGSDWSYNNYTYNIAAIIIEKVSGISFQEYMVTNIFQPAGMINSFVADETHPLKNTVSSYYKTSDGQWMYFHPRRWSFAKGSGNIVSSMDDMLKWDIALRQEKILPKEWLEKAWTAFTLKDGRSTDYGFGWTVSKNNGLRFLTHGGANYGFQTYSVHVPEKNLYLFCANFYSSSDPQNILKKLVCRMLNLSYPVPAKTMIPLSDYAGVYQIHRTGSRLTSQITDIPVYMNVTVSGDTLYKQNTAEEKTYLRPAGKDIFLPARSEVTWYVFSRDANGKVVAVSTKGSFWNYGPDIENKRVYIEWPAPVEAKTISIDLLKKYAGMYYRVQPENLPFATYFIETDGVKLYNKSEGRRQELIPVANNKFVRKGAEDISYEFKSNVQGVLVLTVSGLRSFDYRKINQATL